MGLAAQWMRAVWYVWVGSVALAAPSRAAVMELRGTLGMIEANELGAPIQTGDDATFTICYDEDQPEAATTESDPQSGLFEAIVAGRVEIPAASLDVGFVPDRLAAMELFDDTASAPVLIDTIVWVVDGGLDPLPPVNDPVRAFGVGIQDVRTMPPAPDMVLDANVLPDPALDLDSPGILAVAFSLTSESLASFAAELVDPVAAAASEESVQAFVELTGKAQCLPEPSALLQQLSVAALLLLLDCGVRRARTRRRKGSGS